VIIEPAYSFLDALYMSIITISTAGHLEVHPLSNSGHVWTIIVLVAGVGTGAIMLSLLGAMVVEGQVRRVLGRRQLEQKIKGLMGHVIICGYGRTGEMIAADLKAAGRQTVIVDDDPERTTLAGTGELLYLLGDAQDEEVLKAAGIARAAELVSALPTDAENVMVTLTVRQMNQEIRILTLARDRTAEKKLLQAGATRVICPHVMGASRIVNLVLRPAVVDFFEVAGKGVDLEVDQIVLSGESELLGKSLRELELPRRVGLHVAAIRRSSGETIYRPDSGVTFEVGDTVVVFGQSGAAAALQQLHL